MWDSHPRLSHIRKTDHFFWRDSFLRLKFWNRESAILLC